MIATHNTIRYTYSMAVLLLTVSVYIPVHTLSFPTIQYFDTKSILQKIRKNDHKNILLRYRDDKALIDIDQSDNILTSTLQQQQFLPTTNVPSTTTSNSKIQLTTYNQFEPNIPTTINSTIIAQMIVSQLGMLLLSSIGFGIFLLIQSVIQGGTVSSTTDTMFMFSIGTSTFQNANNIDWKNILFLGCGGAFPLIYTSHITTLPHILDTSKHNRFGSINNNCTNKYSVEAIKIALYRNQMEVSHMVLQLLGKRRTTHQRQQQQMNDKVTEKSIFDTNHDPLSITTNGGIVLLSIISGVTSISSEIIYRLYLPTIVYSITADSILSVIIPAILYGLSHTQWNTIHLLLSERKGVDGTGVDGATIVVLQQTLIAIWYTMINTCTHSYLIPSILAHHIYNMDLSTSSWHATNNRIEYVEQRQQNTVAGDDHQKFPIVELSVEAEQVSRRLFHAFDSQHNGSLTEQDVDHVLEYVLYNTKCSRNNVMITSKLAAIRQKVHQSSSTMDYKEFVDLLHTLYQEQQQKSITL